MSVHTDGDPKIHTLATELVMWLLNYTLQVRRFGESQTLKHHHLYLLPTNEFGVQQIHVHVTEAPDVLVLWSWWEFWWVPICYRQPSPYPVLTIQLCQTVWKCGEVILVARMCIILSGSDLRVEQFRTFGTLTHIGPLWFVQHMLRRFKKYEYVRDAFCQCRVHRLG